MASAATAACSSVGMGSAAASTGAGAFGGATVASSDARIREMGGKTARFVFTAPSSIFLRGFFLSISETLSASCRCAAAVAPGSAFFGGSSPDLAVGAASATSLSTSFLESFVLGEAAGFGAVGLRSAPTVFGAGLRVAFLLLVFVAIVVL